MSVKSTQENLISIPNNAELKVIFTILISLLSGILIKLHALSFINSEWYLLRFVPVIVVGSLMSYFIVFELRFNKTIPLLGVTGCVSFLLCLPSKSGAASVTLSLIHIPLVLLSLLALTFLGAEWRSSTKRILFIRYLGEMMIYAAILLLGGIVLTFLTFALFSLVHINIEHWYMSYVVVFGLTASPLVATCLYDAVLKRESRLATIVSTIFAPLILITACIYMFATITQGKSASYDRNFLITINGLMIIVLATIIYSLIGSTSFENRKLSHIVNISLVTVALLINAYSLSAMLFRWAEYGVTPNRVAVIGENILMSAHLIRIFKYYIPHIAQKCSLERLLNAVTGHIPLYSAWSALMAFGLPLIFGFK